MLLIPAAFEANLSLPGEFVRVAEQCRDEDGEVFFARDCRDRLYGNPVDIGHAGFGEADLHHPQLRAAQGADVQIVARQRFGEILEVGDLEQVVEQIAQLAAALLNDLAVLCVGFGQHLLRGEQLREPRDAVERRAHLVADRIDEIRLLRLAFVYMLHLLQQFALKPLGAAVSGVDEPDSRPDRCEQQSQRDEGRLVVVGREQCLVEFQPVQFVRSLHFAQRLALLEVHDRIPDFHGPVESRTSLGVAVQKVEHPGAFLIASRESHARDGVVFGHVDQRIGIGQRPLVFALLDGLGVGFTIAADAGHGQSVPADRFDELAGQEEVYPGSSSECVVTVPGRPRL